MSALRLSLCQDFPTGAPCTGMIEDAEALGRNKHGMAVMRYEDARRLRGAESFWLRLKFWFRSPRPRHELNIGDLSRLSDHERCDIGLPEQVRYMDWHRLKEDARI